MIFKLIYNVSIKICVSLSTKCNISFFTNKSICSIRSIVTIRNPMQSSIMHVLSNRACNVLVYGERSPITATYVITAVKCIIPYYQLFLVYFVLSFFLLNLDFLKNFKILNIMNRSKDGVKTCLFYILYIFTFLDFNGFLLNKTFIFNKPFDTFSKTLKKKDKMRWDRTDRKKRLMFSIYLQTQTFFFFQPDFFLTADVKLAEHWQFSSGSSNYDLGKNTSIISSLFF